MGADLLLVFQGSHFNSQIPAKIYEYLRTGKPLLGLVDQSGDTATQLQNFENVALANISDPKDIVDVLRKWMSDDKSPLSQTAQEINLALVRSYSRASHTERLATLINDLHTLAGDY